MTTTPARFFNRRDTAANWTSVDPVLGEGEIGIEEPSQRFKFGDGFTSWATLPYAGGLYVDPGDVAADGDVLTYGSDGQWHPLPGGGGGSDDTLNWRGEYDPSATYEEGDVVTYQGSTFRATGPSTGVAPTDGVSSAEWELVAREGAPGEDGAPGTAVPTAPGPFAATFGTYDDTGRDFAESYVNGVNRRVVIVHYTCPNPAPTPVTISATTKVGGVIRGFEIDIIPAGDVTTGSRVAVFPVDPNGTYELTASGLNPIVAVVQWQEIDFPADYRLPSAGGGGGGGTGLASLGEIPADPDVQPVVVTEPGTGWQALKFIGSGDPAEGYPLNGLVQGLRLIQGDDAYYPFGAYVESLGPYPVVAINAYSIEMGVGSHRASTVLELFGGGMSITALPQSSSTGPGGIPGLPEHAFSAITANIQSPGGLAVDYMDGPDWSFVNTWIEYVPVSGGPDVLTAFTPSSGFRPGGMLDLSNVGFQDNFGGQQGAGASYGAAPAAEMFRNGDKVSLAGTPGPAGTLDGSARAAVGYQRGLGVTLGADSQEAIAITQAQTGYTTPVSQGTATTLLWTGGQVSLAPSGPPPSAAGTPVVPAERGDLFMDAVGSLFFRDPTGVEHNLATAGAVTPGAPAPVASRKQTVPSNSAEFVPNAYFADETTFDLSGIAAHPDALRTLDGDASRFVLKARVGNVGFSNDFDALATDPGAVLSGLTLLVAVKTVVNSVAVTPASTMMLSLSGIAGAQSTQALVIQNGSLPNYTVLTATFPPNAVTLADVNSGNVHLDVTCNGNGQDDLDVTYVALAVTTQAPTV